MADTKSKKESRQARRRRNRQTRVRRGRDDDVVTRAGHMVTINGRGDLSILTGLLGTLAKTLLGPLLEGFIGGGDYALKKNSLIVGGNIPSVSSNSEMGGYHRIRHKEWVGTVTSSASSSSSGTNFNLQSYPIQPGLSGTFPWLSQLAAAYQEYELLGMVVFYKPTSGNATGANTSLGQVILSTNYNAAAPNYLNAQAMLNAEFASDGTPAEAILHMIECDPHANPISELFVRTDSVPSGQDQRLFDLANLQVASQGCQTESQQLGEIWIAYDVKFLKPVLGGVVSGLDIPTDHFQLTTVTGSTPLGTSQKSTILGGIGGTINGATGTAYTFPSTINSGTFLFFYTCQGTGAATTAPVIISGGSSWSLIQAWSSNSTPDGKTSVVSTNGINNATFVLAFLAQLSATPITPVSITLGAGGTLPTAPCFGDLVVTQVNSNLIGFFQKLSVSELMDYKISQALERRRSGSYSKNWVDE